MCKGAETLAQTGHRSGGQVQLDLVRAAMFECVTPAMSSIPLKSSGYPLSVYESSISGILINILLWIFNT